MRSPQRDSAPAPNAQTTEPVARQAKPGRPGDALLALQRRHGNRHVQRVIQAKLKVGPVGDRYEREADRVAELAMGPSVQRAPIHPVRSAGGGVVDPVVAQGIERTRGGGGRAVPESVRERMGRVSGADFSGVRIHVGGESDRLNEALGSKAFTVGADVFVRRSEYRPGSASGDALLAHELIHTVQQGATGPRSSIGTVVQRRPVKLTSGATIQTDDISKRQLHQMLGTPMFTNKGHVYQAIAAGEYDAGGGQAVAQRPARFVTLIPTALTPGATFQQIVLWLIPPDVDNGHVVQHITLSENGQLVDDYYEAWPIVNGAFQGGDLSNGTDQFTFGPMPVRSFGSVHADAAIVTGPLPHSFQEGAVARANGLLSSHHSPNGWAPGQATHRSVVWRTGRNGRHRVVLDGHVLADNLQNHERQDPLSPLDVRNYAAALQIKLGLQPDMPDADIRDWVTLLFDSPQTATQVLGHPPYSRDALSELLQHIQVHGVS